MTTEREAAARDAVKSRMCEYECDSCDEGDYQKRKEAEVDAALDNLKAIVREETLVDDRMRRALVHAIRRDHEHRPQACSGCDDAEIVLRATKG